MNAHERLKQLVGIPLIDSSININGKRIHVIEAGEQENHLILLHGLNIGWGQWYPNLEFFSKYYHVHAIDLPGCGLSSPLVFAHSDLVQDFVSIISEYIKIKKLNSVCIVAHSFSAWIALQIGAQQTSYIKKLVLVGPLGFYNSVPIKQYPATIAFLARFLSKTAMKPTRKKMKKFLSSTYAKKNPVDENFVDYYYESVLKSSSHPLLMINRLSRPFKLVNQIILKEEQLHSIKIPILIIIGKQDNMVSHKKVKQLVKPFDNINLITIQNAGHVPSMERSSEFNRVVYAFLDKLFMKSI